jgi:2,5-dihydroxypyridine 5,6-dioxygenase
MSLLQAAVQPAEINPANLAILFQRELELCRVKSGETIALVSDLGTRREYIQSAFAAAGPRSASARAPWKRCRRPI